jgi:mannose-6-phosphate isomerase-like protein (cupin superfamily)
MGLSAKRGRSAPVILGIALAVIIPARVPARDPDPEPMRVVDPATAKYIAIPDMPPCVTAAILRGDPRSGPAWVLLKLTAGCRVPSHWHTANEDLVVISGQGTIAMDAGPPLRFVPGALAALPSHHVHHASCTRTCLLFSIADAAFDIHYVDASGNEISAAQALKAPASTKRRKR